MLATCDDFFIEKLLKFLRIKWCVWPAVNGTRVGYKRTEFEQN